MRLVVILAVSLVACDGGVGGGPDDDVDPTARRQSGSRIKMRKLVSDDGAQDFLGWYDDNFGFNCQFQMLEDPDSSRTGYYCAPVKRARLYFLDAACTDPVVDVDWSSCDAAPYVTAYYNDFGNQCALEATIARVPNDPGSEVDGAPQLYEQRRNCEPVSDNVYGLSRVELIDLSMLAKGHEELQ